MNFWHLDRKGNTDELAQGKKPVLTQAAAYRSIQGDSRADVFQVAPPLSRSTSICYTALQT
jgi:hypothetical protein